MSMFESFHPPSPVMQTVRALLLHRCGVGTFAGTYVLTTHPIYETDDGPIIGEGRTFTHADQQYLLDLLRDNLGSSEDDFLDANVIALNSRKLAWLVPGAVRPMHFRLCGRTVCLTVPWPTLLFKVADGALSVVALSSARRPNRLTRIYAAPLMNVDENTEVCTGTADCPDSWALSDRPGWESVIFDTNFSHTNNRQTVRLEGLAEVSNLNHFRFWRSLYERGADNFPKAALVPLDLTVAEWLAAT